MRVSGLRVAVLAAGVSALLGACILELPAEMARDYERCDTHGGEALCASGVTTCEYVVPGAGRPTCTVTCVEDRHCPAAPSGAPGVCERLLTGAWCVQRCARDEDCARGTRCTRLDRLDGTEVSLCVGE